MSKQPYIAEEPTPISGFADHRGRFHPTRDDALEANFGYDLDAVIADHWKNTDVDFREALENIAAEFPDMLRILVGDRDYT